MTEPQTHPWTARLADVNQRTPIEMRAVDLVWAIEKMGGHPLLTQAQQKVQEALQTLGAWTDLGGPGKNPNAYEPQQGDEVHEQFIPKVKTEVPDSKYSPKDQLVIDEHEELEEKIRSLSDFFRGPDYNTIPLINQHLLIMQLKTMEEYSAILSQRIKFFVPKA